MKKLNRIAAALTACILTGSMLATVSVSAEDTNTEEKTYEYGDVNLDEQIDVSDAVLLARFAAEDKEAIITDKGKVLADVNRDGNLTSEDTVQILEYIAKKRSQLGVQQSHSEYKTVNLMQDIEATEVKGKAVDAAFIGSQYTLAANLLKETAQENTDRKNLLISPLSVSIALSMTANGAKEQTLTEMEKVLGGDLKIDDLNAYYANVLNTLPNSEHASLYPANSIWIRDAERISVPKEFLQTNADYYGADAFKAPFNQDTVNDINAWVNENTHEMIPKLLERVPDENTFMYLINALAFEADWADAYNENQIGKSEFTPYGGDPFETDMLYGHENTYLEDEYATGFIKYYKDNKYSFAAILPKESEHVTIEDYIGMMTAESLQSLLEGAKSCKVETMMPKFKYSYNTSLAKALQKIGMPTAFDDRAANFTGLNAGDGYIGDVLHKTFIQVDEAGTKAGAVTAVVMTEKSSFDPEKPKYVMLDRPFIFMILDEEHDLPVFIGYVMNPTEE